MTTETKPAMTWDDIKSVIAERFSMVADGPGWFGFRWVMSDGRTLRFKMASTTLSGVSRGLLMSPAAPEREIPARRVLEEAANIGPAVVLEEGLYIVRLWLDLEELDRDQLDKALTLVADGVLRLQANAQGRQQPGRASIGRPFANFAD